MTTPPFLPVLIAVEAWNRTTSTRNTVRVADSPMAEAYGLGGEVWEPALVSRPSMTMDVSTPLLDGKLRVGKADFTLNLGNIRAHKVRHLHWRGAPVTIRIPRDLSMDLAEVEFSGRITSARLDDEGRRLVISAEAWSSYIETNLLVREFSGFGGLDGDISFRGTLRPAGFGICEGILPIFFDTLANIGQIDGYGNTLAITRLMEGASDMGPRVADYASYAALRTAIQSGAIAPGQWGTCVADGLVGLGAPPVGVIGVNATFGAGLPGALCKRVLAVHAEAPSGRVHEEAFDALDVAKPYPIHYWTKDQRVIQDLMEAVLGSFNAAPLVTLQGDISTAYPSLTEIITIDCSGRTEPRVKDRKFAEISAPYWQIKGRTNVPANTLSFDQINFIDDFYERGLWDEDVIYYAGNIVTMANGSRWLYVNPTAKSGSEPADDNSDWQRLAGDITASSVHYADGTPIEDLKPAEPGATEGAPTGTEIAGRMAETVISHLDLNTENILQEALRVNDYASVMDARTLVSGQEIGPLFESFRNVQVDQNTIVNTALTLLGAKSMDGNAWILNLESVRLNDGTSLAQYLGEVGASTGDMTGKVSLLMTVMTGEDGNEARAVLKSDLNGVIAGIVLASGEEISNIGLVADYTTICDAEGNVFATFGIGVGGAYVSNLAVDTLTVGAVKTDSIGLNQVTSKEYWFADCGGANGTTLGYVDNSIWAHFGPAGNKSLVEFDLDEDDGEVTNRIFINSRRTGGENDRVSFAIRRSINGGAFTQVGETVHSGAANFPAVLSWEWTETGLPAGNYRYQLWYMIVDGGSLYYTTKMVTDIGKR